MAETKSSADVGKPADAASETPGKPKGKLAPTLYLIIIGKLIKGSLALLLAFGVFKLAGRGDLPELFDHLLRAVHLDPENRFFSEIGDQLDNLKPANVRMFATGTFIYSLFSLVEGIGLIFRVSWAGWMAIGESAFFIPIEAYEVVHRGHVTHHFPWPTLCILIFNVLIVWYLFQNRKRLFHHHHHRD
jgi:uncharacterized membrane protein (DUF2068 family)